MPLSSGSNGGPLTLDNGRPLEPLSILRNKEAENYDQAALPSETSEAKPEAIEMIDVSGSQLIDQDEDMQEKDRLKFLSAERKDVTVRENFKGFYPLRAN